MRVCGNCQDCLFADHCPYTRPCGYYTPLDYEEVLDDYAAEQGRDRFYQDWEGYMAEWGDDNFF